MWNLDPPPGFRGLRDDVPLELYRQFLPHWRQDGATYFVTFRLYDSLPQEKLRELRAYKAEWERRHPNGRSNDAMTREIMRRVEAWLDQGYGSCVLASTEIASLVVESLHRHDGAMYELGCYVVMPNHVHAVVRPLTPSTHPLEIIWKHWKGSSACEINRRLNRSGSLWQREAFDRIVRDPEHLFRVIQYIGRNPTKAGLSSLVTPCWIRPSWIECGWNFDINST